MKYGKIRIENGNLIHFRHMINNVLPCNEILWAYMKREETEDTHRQLPLKTLHIVTKRKKSYQFEMSEREATECLQLLRTLNPRMAVGYPKGDRILQKSLPNTRDLGALKTENGERIIPGRLLRSGYLYHCSLWDQDTLLDQYHLSTVIDLRNPGETEQFPDDILEGVKYYTVPLFDENVPGFSWENGILEILMQKEVDPEEWKIRQYKKLAHDQVAKKQLALFLDILVKQKEGAVLFHDNFGTDRAGIAAAMVLSALGIPERTILDDYMKTNVFLEKEAECLIRYLESKTIVDQKIMDNVRGLFEVKETYMKAFLDEIKACYGGMEHFLKKELYLTVRSLEILKKNYLI